MGHQKLSWRRGVMALLGCCLFMYISIAGAQTVAQLNWGHVLVHNRGPQVARDAFPKALQQVLIKYSGQVNVAAIPNMRSFLAKANQLVLRYAFVAHDKTPATPWQLNVSFDRHAIEQFLLNSGLSIWNADRPLTLCYVYINDGNNTQVLSQDNAPLQMQYMQQVAQQRGVPMLWPLYDGQDQQHVSIEAAPTLALNTASLSDTIQNYWRSRYPVQSILYGVVWHSGTQWFGDWTASYNQQSISWNNKGTDVNAVLGNAVAHLANYLAGQMVVYAQQNVHADQVQLWVSGISGIKNYAALIKYINHFALVSQVAVDKVDSQGVLLTVRTQIGVEGLSKLVQQDNRLSRIYLPQPALNVMADRYYRWNALA